MRPFLVLALAGFSIAVAIAQPPDAHFFDPARDLYRSSAFTHGYIHGYECGFHLGDLDLQLGHEAQTLLPSKVRASDLGYDSSFGDKRAFQQGFKLGLRAGYGDAFRGDAFRGASEVRRAAKGIAPEAVDRSDFDEAVTHGYEAGWQEGLRRPLTSSDSQAANRQCLGAGHAAPYCDAYTRGFGLGYADAAVIPGEKAAQMAKKSE